MENTKSQKKSYSTASSKSGARRKTKTDYYDYSLVAVIVLLTCFGLIMLYSTSSYTAQINYGSDMYFFKKQAIISVACIIMALINAFQLFPQVQIMTEGGPNGATQVMVERIYTYGFKYFKMGYASAYSWLLFVIIFALTLVQMKLQNKWVHYES